ncbi:MAG: radical SAM protein [Thermodesulfobacteriota bacterium]
MSRGTASRRPAEVSAPSEQILELPAPSGDGELRYAVVYPNRHCLGMANLGFQAVVGLLAGLPGARCHRAFADFPRTLEAGRALGEYDVVALSLSFEGDYPEALNLLEAAGVPLPSEDRTAQHPLVLGGGVAVSLNPEPLAPFLDVAFLGEAEAGLARLHGFLLPRRGMPRPALLRELAEAALPGVYVPSCYAPAEGSDRPLPLDAAPDSVARVWAENPWDPARTRILASGDAFGGAYLLEVSRGCPHACRFCAAGYGTRPARFLPLEALLPHARLGARRVGRVGLVGAAVSDHPELPELARALLDEGAGFTVSSFRAENLDPDILQLLVRGGLQTLTVALEAGSERLRRLLGKGISEEDVLRAARMAGEAGLRNLRIYAMVGLPTETDEDVEALAGVAAAARAALGGTVTVSAAPFVPKAHTPFQWEAMAPEALLRSRLRLLQRLCGREKGVRAVGEAPKWARVQGLLSRGGREVAPLLDAARRTGDWRSALRSEIAARVLDGPRDPSGPLPWDVARGLPGREHLLAEREAAWRGAPPRPCRARFQGECRLCGVCGAGFNSPAAAADA